MLVNLQVFMHLSCVAASDANYQPKQDMKTATIRKDYIAIINGDENHPIEGIRAKDANEARKQARWHMIHIVGWCPRHDEKITIKVRLA
jgi:hypothetical protein